MPVKCMPAPKNQSWLREHFQPESEPLWCAMNNYGANPCKTE